MLEVIGSKRKRIAILEKQYRQLQEQVSTFIRQEKCPHPIDSRKFETRYYGGGLSGGAVMYCSNCDKELKQYKPSKIGATEYGAYIHLQEPQFYKDVIAKHEAIIKEAKECLERVDGKGKKEKKK